MKKVLFKDKEKGGIRAMKKIGFPVLALFLVFGLLLSISPAVFATNLTAEKDTVDTDPDYYYLGDTITYWMRIGNAHAEELIHVDEVWDLLPDGTSVLVDSNFDLAPGASREYNLPWLSTISGKVYNTVNASGIQYTPTGEDEAFSEQEKSSIVLNPCVNVTKTVSPLVSKTGDEVVYTIEVCNCGDSANDVLELVSVTDDVLGDLTSYFADKPILQLDECVSREIRYVIKDTDPDLLVNEVTVVYNDILDKAFTATDIAEVGLVHPCLTITKTGDELSKDGDVVNYEFEICNCGDVGLERISVIDTLLGDISHLFPASLAPGECVTVTDDRVVEEGDLPGPLCNTVEAKYQVSEMDNIETAKSNEHCVDLVHPQIEVTKTASPTEACYGDVITYTICVENTGDWALENITVVDSLLGDLSNQFADTLADGEIECHDFDRPIQQGDPNPLINTVDVMSNPVGLPNPIPDRASAEVSVIPCGKATRTPGWWKTHYDSTIHVLNVHLGGQIDMCWKNLDSPADVFGMFWANNTRESDGERRDMLCQARATVAFHVVAAALNNGLSNGAPLPLEWQEIQAIMCGDDISAIRELGAILDTYNNSGDDVEIEDADGYEILHADPKAAKAIAYYPIADCP